MIALNEPCASRSFRSLETVTQRTKTLIDNLGKRRSPGGSAAMAHILAEEQLRLREKLLRKPKEVKVPEPGTRCHGEITIV